MRQRQLALPSFRTERGSDSMMLRMPPHALPSLLLTTSDQADDIRLITSSAHRRISAQMHQAACSGSRTFKRLHLPVVFGEL